MSNKKIMLGNEAIARGAYEAGVKVTSAYPGTPSTEVSENVVKYKEIYAEWAPNEKVATEVAIGASMAGVRSMTMMKMVGLNVASDPLFTAGYIGVNGGMVLVVADDPGIYSSQNEQDTRMIARAAMVPVVEPSDSEEARYFTKRAYELSEKYDTPVILRTTTRLAHSQGIVNLEDRVEVDDKPYERNIAKNVMMPGNAIKRHVIVEQRLKQMAEDACDLDINKVEYNPKDVMAELGSAEYPKNVNIRGYKPNTDVHIGQLKRAIKLLNKAKRPLFLAGGGVVISRAHEIFREVVEKTKVPVVTTVMGKGSIPTDHPLYIGNLGMHGAYAANMAVSNCDVLFSIGTRFNDRITGKLHEFAPHAQIIHIDIDTASISRNIQVDIPIVADAKEAITKMNEYVQECSTDKWLNLIKNWKEEHPLKMRPNDLLSPMDILKEINEQFENSIIVTDVGQHQMLVSQYAEITEGKQMIMSGGLGTMGYGLPGGIGAKIGNPDRPVIVISGDGGVQMNIQELATAVLEELPVILCIFNNEYLGMVRQWQKLFYGKRYSMTNLRSGALSRRTNGEEYPEYTPDFVKLAESYGAKGIRVFNKTEVAAAFEEAKKNTKVPTLIEFVIDPEEMVYPMIKPGGTLEDLIMDC